MRSLRSLPSIGLAVAALSHGGVHAGPPPHRVVRIGITLERPVAAGSRHAPAMIAEADAIWRPYGVAIVLIDPSDPRDVAAADVQLSLAFAPAARRSKQTPGLGAIWFLDDGLPSRSLTIDADFVAQLVQEAGVEGRAVDTVPRALADQMVRRALGRVLAHEVGHFLLASPSHSRSGLMRPAFNGRLLGGFDRATFRLDPLVMPRLHAKLARLESLERPTAAAGDQAP